jgi:hypothetical protein
MILKAKTILVGSVTAALAVGSVFIPTSYAVTGNTTVNVNVGSAISISTSSPINLAITPSGGGSATSASDAVSVSTNNTTGYKLQLADADGANTLDGGGGNKINPASGTFGSPAVLGVNTWGYRVDGAGTFGAGPTVAQNNTASLTGTWAKVPLSGANDVLRTTGSTANNDITTVWYAANVDSTLPNGTYTDIVTYTATTN